MPFSWSDMRTLGLDVGDKTIGVAVSDPLGITAQGVETIQRTGIKKDTARVLELIRENDCGSVVIGLPLSMSGEDSGQTEKIRQFRTKLENKAMSNGLPGIAFFWQDERLTTVQAEKVLIEADVSRKDRKKVIDKQAAVLILQTYLDAHPEK